MAFDYEGKNERWRNKFEGRYAWRYHIDPSYVRTEYFRDDIAEEQKWQLDFRHSQKLLGFSIFASGYFASARDYHKDSEDFEERVNTNVRSYLTVKKGAFSLILEDWRNLETNSRTDLMPRINYTWNNHSFTFQIKENDK